MADALLIFKPDAAYRLAVRSALWDWLATQTSFELAGLHWFKAPMELVEDHYGFLRERPFFPWLVDFMTALPVPVGRIRGEPAALEQVRYELGETIVQKARPGSLRERFGIYAGVNCLHVSDSVESDSIATPSNAGYAPLVPRVHHLDVNNASHAFSRLSDAVGPGLVARRIRGHPGCRTIRGSRDG